MNGTPIPPTAWLVAIFPIIFALFWLLVTFLLGRFSGWTELQRRFPSGGEQPLLTLRMQSGQLRKVNFNNALTLAACASGLRVSVWRIFGPFQRPFQVPWQQIRATPAKLLFTSVMRLDLGQPPVAQFTIRVRTWERLKSAGQMTL